MRQTRSALQEQRPRLWQAVVGGVLALLGASSVLSAQESAPGARMHLAQTRQVRQRVGYFRDKNGVVTITNRPEKYEQRDGYDVVEIKYERVTVPAEYQEMKSASSYTSASIANLVRRYARAYGLNENLVFAVIKAESNFNPYARSPKGACGLMQLMPDTAAEMGVTNIFNPAQNIAAGTQYLAKVLQLFNYDYRKALAAYNAGPSVVKKHGGVPPFQETQDYVRDVLASVQAFDRAGSGAEYAASAYKSDSPPKLSVTNPPPETKKYYTIRFNSGLTQPAEEVLDEPPFYRVRFGNRIDFIRKDHVREIEEPA